MIIKTSRLTLYLIDDSLTPLKLGMPLDIPQGGGSNSAKANGVVMEKETKSFRRYSAILVEKICVKVCANSM